jgi:hypothetical protein
LVYIGIKTSEVLTHSRILGLVCPLLHKLIALYKVLVDNRSVLIATHLVNPRQWQLVFSCIFKSANVQGVRLLTVWEAVVSVLSWGVHQRVLLHYRAVMGIYMVLNLVSVIVRMDSMWNGHASSES